MANEPGFTPIAQQAAPGFTPVQQSGADAATEQAAQPWRTLTTGAGIAQQAREVPSAVWDTLKGMYGMGKDILFPPGATEGERLGYLGKKYISEPFRAEMTKAQTAQSPWESIGHSTAAAIPLFGPMVAQLGEELAQGKALPAAAQAGTAYLGGKVLGRTGEAVARGAKIPGIMAEAEGSGLSEGLRMRAEARARVYQESLQQQLKQAKALHMAEVEQSVQRLVRADVAENARRGGTGSIDRLQATTALDKVLKGSGPAEEGVGIQARQATANAMGELADQPPKLTFEQAKNLRTVLGDIMMRARSSADRAPVAAAYDALTQQMKARGEALSPGDWRAYNEIHSKLQDARGDWLDDAINATDPYTLRDTLRGKQWGKARQWVKETQDKFGQGVSSKAFKEDLDSLHKNVEWAPARPEGASFGGMMRTIQKQPLAAGAAWTALQAIGVPWVAKLLGVWEAGKAADVYQQLGELKMTPPSVTGTPNPAPGTTPSTTAAGGGVAPAASGGTPEMESEMEAARRGAPGISPTQRSLARNLEKARRDRASGVYRGKR
jgi:hypothetical protein